MVTREFWRDRSVFVTGHTGFKGGWLATSLLGPSETLVSSFSVTPMRPSTPVLSPSASNTACSHARMPLRKTSG